MKQETFFNADGILQLPKGKAIRLFEIKTNPRMSAGQKQLRLQQRLWKLQLKGTSQ